jgi:hypothetical protein
LVLALGLPAIAQAQAALRIDHAFVADLDIVPRSPAATTVPAINRTDGDGNNFCPTLLDDESAAEARPPKPLALVVGPGEREAIGRQRGARPVARADSTARERFLP